MTVSGFGATENEVFVSLYRGNLVPLYLVVPSLTWVIHDYFITLEDEVEYIWTQKRSFAKFMYLWMRYYTIFLLIFDVLQIHGFAIRGFPTKALCIAADPVTRLLGGISLWSVEITMQLRVYALYNSSKKIAIFNASVFLITIGLFLYLMIINAMNRGRLISAAMRFPLPGCPTINGGSQWALWLPATIFELILFSLVAYKAMISVRAKLNGRASLGEILIHENMIYFTIVTCLLIFNNLMAVRETKIPWLSFGPFHAAMGITTCRLLVHLRKFTREHLEQLSSPKIPDLEDGDWQGPVFTHEDDPRRSSDTISVHCEELEYCRPRDEESLVDVAESSKLGSTSRHSRHTEPALGEAGPSRIA